MSLIETINASSMELEEIEQQMRGLAEKKANILHMLRSASTYIGEILESGKVKPAAIPISSVAGLDDLSRKHLKDAGIEFLEDMGKMTELEVQKIPGLGAPAFEIIRSVMPTHNLNFAT
ncbi:hypothetical protein IPH92_03850 [Candidatus Kaiserbacteria bacterium]|nr:MAG: hypothetical protein IPH92_03850 [Candidatus Kaiserbacteria bacterium]